MLALPIAFLVVLVYSMFMVLGIKGLLIVRKPNGHYNFTIRLDIPCSRILTLPSACPSLNNGCAPRSFSTYIKRIQSFFKNPLTSKQSCGSFPSVKDLHEQPESAPRADIRPALRASDTPSAILLSTDLSSLLNVGKPLKLTTTINGVSSHGS